jgi:acetyl esterase
VRSEEANVGLDPVTAMLNDQVNAVRATAPPPTVQSMRDGYALFIEQVGTAETMSKVEELEVEGLPSLSFTPPECDDGLLVWFHGGGWTISEPRYALNEVDRLAVAARCRAISVGYRLAPEYPFPEPQLDGITAANWCVEHAKALGADPRRVAVGGDSAGGNLAAVAGQRVDGLCAQVLVYPAADLRAERRASYPHLEGYFLDGPAIDFFYTSAAGEADLDDPILSPAAASDELLAASPPTLVITAEYDPLRDDGVDYAALLARHGVAVETRHYEHQMHGFLSWPELSADARDAIETAGRFLAGWFDAD